MGSQHGQIYQGQYLQPLKIPKKRVNTQHTYDFEKVFGRIETTRAIKDQQIQQTSINHILSQNNNRLDLKSQIGVSRQKSKKKARVPSRYSREGSKTTIKIFEDGKQKIKNDREPRKIQQTNIRIVGQSNYDVDSQNKNMQKKYNYYVARQLSQKKINELQRQIKQLKNQIKVKKQSKRSKSQIGSKQIVELNKSRKLQEKKYSQVKNKQFQPQKQNQHQLDLYHQQLQKFSQNLINPRRNQQSQKSIKLNQYQRQLQQPSKSICKSSKKMIKRQLFKQQTLNIQIKLQTKNRVDTGTSISKFASIEPISHQNITIITPKNISTSSMNRSSIYFQSDFSPDYIGNLSKILQDSNL